MASPGNVFASTVFVQRLIDRGTIERLRRAQADALVVYRSNGVVTHIGQAAFSDRVQHKWGVGHIYRHDLFEVPLQYGDDLEFYGAISRDLVLEELAEFAGAHGVRFVGDSDGRRYSLRARRHTWTGNNCSGTA